MKILLDHCVPKRLRDSLKSHEVHTAREMHWEQLKNGNLLAEAAAAGFDAIVTVDRNLKHQQNLTALPLPVFVLLASTNRLPDLIKLVPRLEAVLSETTRKSVIEIATP